MATKQIKGVLGEKLGMTQVFDEAGKVVPVTVLKAGPCVVSRIRTPDTDGYSAIQLGYGQVNPDGPSKLRFPIVGGTGRYANVRGYLDVRNLSERKTKLDFHLLP